MGTLNIPTSHPSNLGIARRLARLDRAMRRPNLGERAAIQSRVRFFETAISAGIRSDTSLNGLGDLVEQKGTKTALSERSYDLVFEDGEISDKVVVRLVHKANQDPSFEQLLIDAGFRNCLADWRVFAAKAAA